MSRKLFISTLVSIPLLMTTTGSGATGIHEPASQSLFDEGRELMIQGNFAEACAKFETSYELEPGLGTLLNLALCHEKRGQLATAYVKYNDAFTLALRAGDEARVALAKKRLDALTPRLSRIVIDADARHLPSGAWITMDGTPMDRALLGVPFPVDGGQHELVIGADGMETVKIIVTVDAEGTTKTVHLPVLESVPRERSGSMTTEADDESLPVACPEQTTVPDHHNSGQGESAVHELALGATLGVGLLSAALATYFGLDAVNAWDERNAHCDGGGCDPDGVAAGRQAERSAALANALAVLSGVGFGAGAYLYFRPRPPEASSGAGWRHLSTVALGIQGSFQ